MDRIRRYGGPRNIHGRFLRRAPGRQGRDARRHREERSRRIRNDSLLPCQCGESDQNRTGQAVKASRNTRPSASAKRHTDDKNRNCGHFHAVSGFRLPYFAGRLLPHHRIYSCCRCDFMAYLEYIQYLRKRNARLGTAGKGSVPPGAASGRDVHRMPPVFYSVRGKYYCRNSLPVAC